MKQELLDKGTLFNNQNNNIIAAVTYRSYYKEDIINFDYPNGINPNPKIVEDENVDFFTNLDEAKNRFEILKKNLQK